MPQSLNLTLVQPDNFWENTDANLAHLEEMLSQQEVGDVIVFPEMFNTGFSMDVEKLAEPMHFKTFRWMSVQADRHNSMAIGSFIVKEAGKYFNRCVAILPGGAYHFYDKAYSFRMMDENHYFTSGVERKIVDWRGWKILPLICYDLRFPEWSRNSYERTQGFSYDLIIYVANWPSARIQAWDGLLKARAIENSCYVAGVNRIGKDGNGIDFNGHSTISDPKGNYLLDPYESEEIKTVKLDLENLTAYREKFQVHLDW